MEPERISADEVRRRMSGGEAVTFVDARSASAWQQADQQIPGSIRVPPDEVASHMDRVPRNGLVVAYCT